MSEPALKTVDLVKGFEGGRVRALDGVSIEVAPGEAVAIMGPSGCGKTTLLNLVGALDMPTSGEVWINGRSLREQPDLDVLRAREIGFIFQLHNLIPTLTAAENVEIPMVALSTPRRERRTRALELLERVGLKERADFTPPKLSGGERQRVAVARALANSPRLLLADEPTGNLDSKSGEAIIRLLLDLKKDQGVTLLLVTHDASVAERMDREVRLRDGRIENGA